MCTCKKRKHITHRLKVRVKSKLTIFILLAHLAIFVVNNSFMQVNPQKKWLPS